MRILDRPQLAYLSARTGVASRHMVHVIGRNRDTNAQEPLGVSKVLTPTIVIELPKNGTTSLVEAGDELVMKINGLELAPVRLTAAQQSEEITLSSGGIPEGSNLITAQIVRGEVTVNSNELRYTLDTLAPSAPVVSDWSLSSVAGRLSKQGDGNALIGLQDGYYTVAIYSEDSSSADAFLFNIRVDGGDSLDFGWGADIADTDFDMIEYVGVVRDVGADTLQAVNFI